jgi:hypothetical protein
MTFPAFIILIALTHPGQSGAPATAASTACLSTVDTRRLALQESIEGRIRIYREFSERYRASMEDAARKQAFDQVPALLACWQELLASSLKDIEATINRRKKSGALINYEIQVRKSINDVNDVRLKAPYQLNNEFIAWSTQADAVRKRFVDILFQR